MNKKTSQFHIVLFQPEIPPNTGNIMRLSANTNCQLHLIEPLGFTLDEKRVKRAGMDYRDLANVTTHRDFDSFLTNTIINQLWMLSTKGSRNYCEAQFTENDAFMFGPETRGLPDHLLSAQSSDHLLRIPMMPNSRSLNLSNAVAVVVYEGLRQLNFRFDLALQ